MKKYSLIVIGGSAAGLCAAINAARLHNGFSVAVLEKLPRAGKKILATGNGRCNLSNTGALNHPYRNAVFAKTALERYPVERTLSFFRSIGLLTYTDAEGRVYPLSNTAASVADALRFEAERLGVDILCGRKAQTIRILADGAFEVGCEAADGAGREILRADKLIVAAGGKASPVHGSDGSGYGLLKQFGHSVTPVYPSLAPMETDSPYPKQLKGIRANARVSIRRGGETLGEAKGEVLFTDYGLSGIAAMEAGRAVPFAQGALTAVLDLVPEKSEEELAVFLTEFAGNHPALRLEHFLFGILHNKLGQVVCKVSGLYNFAKTAGSLTDKEIRRIVRAMKAFSLSVKGTKGFADAQVTAGGAAVDEFNPATLESCKVNSLYCCGEILDIDGGCGGYNLQWAWSSGLLAGELGGV